VTFELQIEFDPRQTDDLLARLKTVVADRVIGASLNRAITKVRTEAGRELRRNYILPVKRTTGTLRLFKAYRNHLWASIALRGGDSDPPLYLFKPHWKAGQPIGATVLMRPGQGRVAIPHAFNIGTRYRPTAVYQRVGPTRYPIRLLLASDAGGRTFGTILSAYGPALLAFGRAEFIKNATRLSKLELTVVLNKYRSPVLKVIR